MTKFDANKETGMNPVLPIASPIQNEPEISANKIPDNREADNKIIPTPSPTVVLPAKTVEPVASDQLMIPVPGVKKEQLTDTFNDARSENRVHNAIDIPAAQGTEVLAVADGQIARFFDSKLGGITIYQFSKDRKTVYYYAHLMKIAENLSEKAEVRQGNVIGYVGDTGNAGAGNFHLHFSVIIPADEKRYWEGENVNPFLLLMNGIEGQKR
ncbi:MAG: M23 family metallopeptidase [Pyrinomonadaceae bacterium]|nr:M23 family metallopeptidase [Pyrinomonadaceae bacterium]